MSNTQTIHPPLTGAKLVLGSLGVGLAGFMTVLDSSIANVAIPTISGNLGTSVDIGTWVITVFAASNSVSIPLTGWLTQRLGQVRLFIGSILLFVLSSWLCGVAPSLPVLLFARVLQGAVAGPLIPMSQALLLSSWPREKSSMALSLFSMIVITGPIVGPALGGWVTDSYSWSWIFYVNIPVGLFSAAVVWALYRERDTPTKKLPVDLVGLLLLITWVASLQVMLDQGKDLDWFSSTTIVVLAIVALIAFAFFVAWELTDKNPVVDLSLFKQRNFLGGTISLSIAYGIFFGTLVLLPQWMQEYLGYRAVDAGLATAPLGFFAVLGAPIMGKILPRSDARILATCAFIGFAIVYYMRSYFYTDIDVGHIVLPT
ncbi:DHA2 family efflux MFS transporter permease subunit, partial [Caballeronia mineralivorans]|uniref:DHA2 family efflux MFS transporter permease subunit n=1 Tax=Caballeronia mineralivorans TaxID=2010198 RepID=UPI0023F38BF1